MKGISGSLQTSVVITKDYNVTVNSMGLVGTTEYLTQYVRYRINRRRYNRMRLFFFICYHLSFRDGELIIVSVVSSSNCVHPSC